MFDDRTDRSDAMIARLEAELEERNAFIQGTIGGAQDKDRDLSENEVELIRSAKSRVDNVKSQLDTLYDSRQATLGARERAIQVQREMNLLRRQQDNGPVTYESAGAYLFDTYSATLGNRDASERLDVFHRAAAHQKTSDNLGVVPDPIVGQVVNFIDAARPLVSFDGPLPLPAATWYRPKVTQHTTVGKQGSAGAAADEKSELVSQKMTITRVTGNAVTYGGYVNVSRQNMDLSAQVFDIVVNDLAAQYAIQTEAALGTVLAASANTIEIAGTGSAAFTQANLTAALWTGAANLYTATKGAGRICLGVAPDQIGNWGSVFNPVNPQNAQSTGFSASGFGQGILGYVSGIPVIVSAGLPAGTIGVLFSTAAVECYEQRVGQLQVVEPSVLGVQVAYAGYFTPMVVESAGIQKLINAA
jgi:HK97 family phage major capsid protein